MKPYEYLLYLFNEMPSIKALTPDSLKQFMPWSERAKIACGYSDAVKQLERLKMKDEDD